MAVPIQPSVTARPAVPVPWLTRTAVGLFIAALTVALLPAGPPPASLGVWSAAVVAGFTLSAAAAIASQARGHRVVRTRLGYWALAALTAALLAMGLAALPTDRNPEMFLSAGTVAAITAAVLGTLAAFRAAGARIRFLPTTPAGWWAAAFLASFLILGFSPWAVLTPATVMAGPALALAAIVSYQDRSVLTVIALVAGPGQLAFFDLAVLISTFTPHP